MKLAQFIIFWLIPLSVYANANDPNVADKAYNRRIRQRVFVETKKWRSLRAGMDERRVLKILGKPKLIQGGSDISIWHYQHLPGPNSTTTQQGSVCFKAKTIDKLLAEEEALHVQKILDLIARSKASPSDYKVGQSLERYSLPAITHRTRTKNQWRSYLKKNKGRSRMPWLEWKEQMNIKLTQNRKAKFAGFFEILVADYEKKIKQFTDDNILRQPVFVLSHFSEPEWDVLLFPWERKRYKIKPQEIWQSPLNWRKLRINMTPKKVHAMLGTPAKIETNTTFTREYYGDSSEDAIIYFTVRSDTKERLASWKEPFWLNIDHEIIQKK